MMKRAFDIVAAGLGLIVCLPLFVVVSLLIKLESRGPILFKQIRMGKGFRPFHIYKFRSMARGPLQRGNPSTRGTDPHITRVGRLLRQYKLDELPQLLNVLKGDMSLVGPRPEVPQYVDMFAERYRGILTVRPGLTDLAILRYIDDSEIFKKTEKPEEEYVQKILPEKIRLATVYIEHAGFLFDLFIIAQTLFKLIGVQVVLFELPDMQHHVQKVDHRPWASLRRVILKYRRPFIIFVELALVVIANYLAFWLRFDGQIPIQEQNSFLRMLPWLIVIRGCTFFLFRLNEGLWRYTSIWDLQRIVGGVLTGTLLFYLMVHVVFSFTIYPRSVYIIDSILLIGFLVGVRLPSRFIRERTVWNRKKRILVFGAGDAGERIVREMKTHPSYPYEPIGFIDDEQSLVGQSIHGVKVLGTRKALPTIFSKRKPEEVLVALPGTNPATLREILKALEPFKVPIKTLPAMRDLLDGKVTISQIRNLAIEDLLPRPPVGLKRESISHLIAGKSVFVTGAGGSIGSELCRQIVEFNPKTLVLYERYENSLYTIVNELADRGHSSLVHPVIGDITDSARLHRILKDYRPDIIFHAAAHKHVPLMELNPGEALKNNVLGTQTVAEAAAQLGVKRFVMISTDKAVNPSSVMGATKRGAELVVQSIARRSQTRFITVRFGNVLGSNGSVVPRFQEQIKAGGPVTVTHPNVRRYFMLISEAVHLVLQAAAVGEQSGLYILDMGDQIKLLDLARNLIRLSGFVPDKEIPITIVGLRPGEKLEEELVGAGEVAEPSSIDKILKIRSVAAPDLTFFAQKLADLKPTRNTVSPTLASESPVRVIEQLRELVPAFEPQFVEPSVTVPDPPSLGGSVTSCPEEALNT